MTDFGLSSERKGSLVVSCFLEEGLHTSQSLRAYDRSIILFLNMVFFVWVTKRLTAFVHYQCECEVSKLYKMFAAHQRSVDGYLFVVVVDLCFFVCLSVCLFVD